VQVGFPIYLNVYHNPEGSTWSISGSGMSRVDRLRLNTSNALRVSDEYVWVYNEKYSWWPLSGKEPMFAAMTKQSWPEALPGCDSALRMADMKANNLRQYAQEMIKSGKIANLARNGDFESEKVNSPENIVLEWKEGGAPAGWGFWQDGPKSNGTFTWDREDGHDGKGCARAVNIIDGCLLQGYKVKPGECYAIRAFKKIHGQGDAFATVRWRTPDGIWTAPEHNLFIPAYGPKDQWVEIFDAVRVPEAASELVLLLFVKDQSPTDSIVFFDDVTVARLE